MIKRIPSAIKTFGNSMYPLLQNGDVVYLRKIQFSKIRVNDIICAKKNNKFFTHRVIYVNEKYAFTKGDTNRAADGRIYPKNIVGRVYKIKRGGDELGINDLYLMQSTLYFREISLISKALIKANIQFVILKGIPLYLYIEGKHPKRVYADCDVLINKDEFGKAKKLISKLRYEQKDNSLSPIQKKLKDKEPEITFIKSLSGFPVTIDLHSEVVFMMTQLGKLDSIYPQKLIDSLSEKFIRDKKVIKIYNSQFPVLSPADLFIYLCLHLMHHNFNGAHRLEFIKEIIKREPLNWSLINSIIEDYKLKSFIAPAIFLLQKYYHVHFPERFLKEMRRSSKHMVIKNIFDSGTRDEEGIKRFKIIFQLSPEPFLSKVRVFLNPQVASAILWVMFKRIRRVKLLFSFP